MKKLWNAPMLEELDIQETACPPFGGPSYPSQPNKPVWPPFFWWWPPYPPCGGGDQGNGSTGDDTTDFAS